MKHCWWIVVFCAAFALGCSDKEAERSDSDGDDTKTTTGDAPTNSGGKKEGQQAAKKDPRTPTKRPDDMPSDVPMYPYVQIKVAPGEARAKMMVMETDDAFEDVRSYYVDEFKKNGWKTLHNAPQAIVVEKGDRKTSVSIQKVASITRIIMNFMGQ
jgi:hypothetical protein